ncbi:carbon-nitrogen hydrolase family protein [Chloroflexota bacterium]
MSADIKIAAVQMEPRLMKIDENLASIQSLARKAAADKARLMVFPECALTGYIFYSRKEAIPYAETVPGPTTETLASLCRELDVYIVFGLLEKENDKLFNTAALLGPQGFIAGYRKNHPPFLGIDRFVDRGDRPFQVHPTPIGNIGLEICYDICFPESSRVIALAGADILALPTNFPQDRGEKLNVCVRSRAIENKVHVVSADRIGSERDYTFAGLSNIVDATGDILSLASTDREEIIYGNVNLEAAREKSVIRIPGVWETHYWRDRRPELYGRITKPNQD